MQYPYIPLNTFPTYHIHPSKLETMFK